MTNPFEPPQQGWAPPTGAAPSMEGTGTLDIGRAVSEGWARTLANPGVLWISYIALMLCLVVSVLACFIPLFVVGPVLAWGWTRLMLEAYDGTPRLETMFSGFQDFGRTFWGYFSLLLIYGVVGTILAVFAAGFVLAAQAVGEEVGILLAVALLVPLGLVLLLITVRFSFASYLIVERGVSAVDALSLSWEAAGPVWALMILQLIVLMAISCVGQLAITIITLPLQLLMSNAGEAGAVIGGLFSFTISMAIAPLFSAFIILMQISGYRQVMGRLGA